MHQSAQVFLMGVAATIDTPREYVVEFGSLNVNGSARNHLPAWGWWGLDLVAGRDVDEVAHAASWVRPEHLYVDTVVCTEVLEHTLSGDLICANAHKILARGGVFIVTCAGPGRTPHGVRGLPHPQEAEYYRAVDCDQLASWISAAGFRRYSVIPNDVENADTYAVAWR